MPIESEYGQRNKFCHLVLLLKYLERACFTTLNDDFFNTSCVHTQVKNNVTIFKLFTAISSS